MNPCKCGCGQECKKSWIIGHHLLNGNHPMLGKHFSKEHNDKYSISMKGRKAWNKGIPRTLEERKHMSEACKGRPGLKGKANGMFGKKLSLEKRKFISKVNKGIHKGNKNANWKGGITTERHKIKHTDKYKQWLQSIL